MRSRGAGRWHLRRGRERGSCGRRWQIRFARNDRLADRRPLADADEGTARQHPGETVGLVGALCEIGRLAHRPQWGVRCFLDRAKAVLGLLGLLAFLAVLAVLGLLGFLAVLGLLGFLAVLTVLGLFGFLAVLRVLAFFRFVGLLVEL